MENNYSLSHRNKEPENGVLYLVGTPIGNLNDISVRAINILKNVSLIACEDTRHTKKILNRFEISNHLISFNKYNSFNKTLKIINYLKQGKSIALVSDAGIPGICDPGEDLVREAKLNLLDTICIPGPCALITALASSGFPSSKFSFDGFLPKKNSDRIKIINQISIRENTTILFESPHRLLKLLNELKESLGGQREIQVFRELTKKYEEHIGANIDDVLNYFNCKEVIGEITIVIKGIDKRIINSEFNEFELKKELYELVDAGLTLSAASKYLGKRNNLKKSDIYNLY